MFYSYTVVADTTVTNVWNSSSRGPQYLTSDRKEHLQDMVTVEQELGSCVCSYHQLMHGRGGNCCGETTQRCTGNARQSLAGEVASFVNTSGHLANLRILGPPTPKTILTDV